MADRVQRDSTHVARIINPNFPIPQALLRRFYELIVGTTYSYVKKAEFFSDSGSGYTSNGPRTTRCSHTKVTTKVYPDGPYYPVDTGWTYLSPNYRHLWDSNYFIDSIGVAGHHGAHNAPLPPQYPPNMSAPSFSGTLDKTLKHVFPQTNFWVAALELLDISDLISAPAEGVLRSAADGWLRSNLGVLPLMSTIAGYLNSGHLVPQATEFSRLLETEGARFVNKRTYPFHLYQTGGYDSFTRIRGNYTVKFYAKARGSWQVPSSYFDFSFGLGDAWELIPFSFLVDYVIPIGDALINAPDIQNLEILDQGVSCKFKGEVSTGRNGVTFCKSKITKFYRTPWSWVSPSDMSTLKDLRLREPSWRQMTTAVSLIR